MLLKGLNRNILECKCHFGYNDIRCRLRVLIETYWNVNETKPARLRKTAASLNRNILECKCLPGCFFQCRRISLNRNILECKLNTSVITNYSISVLIETYWNVNIREIYVDIPNDVGLNRNILECKCVNVICRMC